MSTYFAAFGNYPTKNSTVNPTDSKTDTSTRENGSDSSTGSSSEKKDESVSFETIRTAWDAIENAAVMHLSNRARGASAAFFYSSNLLS